MLRILLLLNVITAIHADLTWDSITSPVTQKRLKKLMDVAGRLEWVHTIVDDLCAKYSELRPSTEEGLQALKVELNLFFMSSKHDQDEFPMVSEKFAQLRIIAEREIYRLRGNHRGLYEDVDHFIASHLYTSMTGLQHRRITNSHGRAFTELEAKEAELWESWLGFRPESELEDIIFMAEHLKYEL